MRVAAVISRGNKKGKKGKKNFLPFLPFLLFLLPCITQRIYDALYPGVAAMQRNAEIAQRLPVILAPTTSAAELRRREKLLTPGVARRAANVASATRRPWLDANGWRFLRRPAGKFYYELPRGRATLAAAETFAYNADAVLKIDPVDAEDAAKMLDFLKQLPPANLPAIADIGVIDDGTDDVGEVMNLLARRNLLFKVVAAPSPQLRVNIRLGSKEFPRASAANPSDFAQTIRRKLGDENRTLRVYGTEMVICRLVGDGARARLHLLNYSGREVEGLRVRLRSRYGEGAAMAFGFGRVELGDVVNDETATEFSISKMGVYAVVDLPALK
jgi:hypothetical protein